ncbi:MAG TPA: methionyl-tRNA formyltransferase [Acidimicrobiales bacterium]|nr:methionyl-tRNA formyltransferase [Acidimicrobiales bacterium]
MRLAFLGTPAAAVPPLEALLAAGHDVRLVVSQPDRKRGRGGALVPSPVKVAALAHDVPVTDRVDDVLAAGVELGVVVAFGKLIKAHVLAEVPMVNLHFSLLPRWRGAAPVERAILAGDAETGVCLMALDPGLDTGPVHECARTPIRPEEHVDDLRSRLVDIGTRLLVEALDRGVGEPVPQQGEPTYAAKIDPAELELDLTQPAEVVHRTVRLGRAWTTFRGARLQVVAARPQEQGPATGTIADLVIGCGGGTGLELLTVKPEGRAAQPAAAWRNGARPRPGEPVGRGA